jgi:predicted ATPase/DNA-binding SARP family transcriptional activator
MVLDSPAVPLSIRLLGPFEVRLHGTLLPPLRSRKGHWLLALLVLQRGAEVGRDWLAGILWPESPLAAGRANLRSSVRDLRQALGPEAARLRSPSKHLLALDLSDAWADVLAFDLEIARGDPVSLEQAVALHRGPLLEGCAEAWAFQERSQREQAYLRALEALATHALSAGDAARAEQLLRLAVVTDPLRESAQRALMQLLARVGSYTAAMQTYQELRLRLYRDLNSQPDPDTQALFHQIQDEVRARADGATGRRGDGARGMSTSRFRTELPPVVVAPSPRRPVTPSPSYNLPAHATPLIGRESEVAAVQNLLLREGVRLVTLTGPGGTGKTRLALQAAANLVEQFDDGAFFVDLAPIRDPALVVSAIAQVLGVQDSAGQTLQESVRSRLRGKQLLLVLDNFEQVLEAAPVVAELLAGAPRLKVLVTSRATLRLHGENEFPVPPLALPDPKHSARLEALSRYAAVELFIQRAMAARPEFVVTNENAPAVAEICVRLDGLPLAIELAAARVKLFAPRALLPRLQNRLKLLTGGARNLPLRQQALRNTIAWSHDLLDASEKALFRRAAVFVDGFTLEAGEAVCNAPGDLEVEFLDAIVSLIDQNLLRYEEGPEGEPRFRMLETIREFAAECLEASGEAEAIRKEHARFFIAWVGEAPPSTQGPEEARWLDGIEREQGNVRAVLTWLMQREALAADLLSDERALRFGATLARFWSRRGHQREGREWLNRLLERPWAAGRSLARVDVLHANSRFNWLLEDQEAARVACLESLALCRELENPAGIARALCALGRLSTLVDRDYEAARSLIEEGLALWREQGDRAGIAEALDVLGVLAFHRGDLEGAWRLWEEWAAVSREIGEPGKIRPPVANLAIVAFYRGDDEMARRLSLEALAIARETDNRSAILGSLKMLGDIAYQQGDLATAREYREEGLPLAREHEEMGSLTSLLQGLGELAALSGDYPTARALFEEALELGQAIGREALIGPYVMAGAQMGLGDAACAQSELAAAAACYREALWLWPQWRWPEALPKWGPKVRMAHCLEGLGRVAWKQGRLERAARCLAAAETLRKAIGARLPAPEAPGWERSVAAVRCALSEEAFATAWEAGRAMTLEEAVADALEATRADDCGPGDG